MKTTAASFAVAALLALPASPALAINMMGFKDAPISRLSADELKAYRAWVIKALNEAPQGAILEWKAPKATFKSSVTLQDSFDYKAMKCRRTQIESDSHDRYARGIWVFCKKPKQEWQITFPTEKPKAKGS